ELLEMSRTDPLTGLANRRHFEQHQIEELHRAQRLGYPVSLLMLDVDFFKGYNDRYGHAEGDACLAALANLMKDRFKRAGEMVARGSGVDFAVLLPGLDLDAAMQCAEALGTLQGCVQVQSRQQYRKFLAAYPCHHLACPQP